MADRLNQAPGQVWVSVVLATYNRAALLEEAIRSLLIQTLAPERFEILVIDDASTDGTEAMLRLFADVPGLRYHRLPHNSGVAVARNTGVRLARGPVIAFMDNDCWAAPDWLARGLAAIGSGAALATGPVLDKPGQRLTLFTRSNATGPVEHPSYPACNAFYDRRTYLELGGLNEKLCFRGFGGMSCECSDADLAWRLKGGGHASVFVPEMAVFHEVEYLSFPAWLMNPLRLFVLPALVKRHPQLRRRMLKGRVFFAAENAWFYVAVLGIALSAVHGALTLLLAAPFLWMHRAHLMDGFSLARLPRILARTALLSLQRGILCLGLIYGSLRFRCLVL